MEDVDIGMSFCIGGVLESQSQEQDLPNSGKSLDMKLGSAKLRAISKYAIIFRHML